MKHFLIKHIWFQYTFHGLACISICQVCLLPARVGRQLKSSQINLNWVYSVVFSIEKMALFHLLSKAEQELHKIRGMYL